MEYLLEGISDLNEIATRLKLSKATTLQHLNILLTAKIVEKSTSSDDLRPTINYRIGDNAKELITAIQKACRNFLELSRADG